MKAVGKEYLINAPAEKVWQALVDPKVIAKWGGGPAKMDGKEGSKFSLWGGDIHGKNTKVIERKLLEQDWFSGDWKEASKVRFELKAKEQKTRLLLIHENVPQDEFDDISQGWDDYYIGPIKDLLEQ